MENRIKKDMYNASPVDLRTYVNGELAMKPYYYFRNGLVHIRYTVDRCIELTKTEQIKLKTEMTSSYDKQKILADTWNFLTNCVRKPVIEDGIAEMEKRMKQYASKEEQNG